jgi:hypothetical protein
MIKLNRLIVALINVPGDFSLNKKHVFGETIATNLSRDRQNAQSKCSITPAHFG